MNFSYDYNKRQPNYLLIFSWFCHNIIPGLSADNLYGYSLLTILIFLLLLLCFSFRKFSKSYNSNSIKFKSNCCRSKKSSSFPNVITMFSPILIIFICLTPFTELTYASSLPQSYSNHRQQLRLSAQLLPSHQIDRLCTCTGQMLQQKFCQHDFVYLAKKINRGIKKFNEVGGETVADLVPYRGEIMKFRLYYSFKGSLTNYENRRSTLKIYVVKGYSCGILRSFQFRRHRLYLMTGFLLGSKLVITSCSWVEPFDKLSAIQTLGLFQGFYQSYCHLTDQCQITHYNQRRILSERCSVKITYKSCYEKYAICNFNTTLTSNNGDYTSRCSFIKDLSQLNPVATMSQLKDNNPSLYPIIQDKIDQSNNLPFNPLSNCLRIRFSQIGP